MQKFLNPDDWLPVDGFELEGNALETVKSTENRLIVAGPGAGKTELLAQRACYLLQTNSCPTPRKILAISFKRDAAFNLAERVQKRVGKVFARRFVSLTYDAFAKGLVDRFRNGIPDSYRPNGAYKIETAPYPSSILSLFEEFDTAIAGSNLQVASASIKAEFVRSLYNQSYPVATDDPAIELVLSAMFKREGQEILTFPILSRLAEYLLETNPKIISFLRQTYSHIFLDEFQDTTTLQYDLLKTVFLGSNSTLTAVGDTKQRIMLWAGAMDGIFKNFENDFSALALPLVMNFRSAPRLIRLQNHLAKELLSSDIECLPGRDRNEEEGVAEFWFFDTVEQEAQIIAREVKRMIEEEALDPREICLLYKQRPDVYAAELQNILAEQGIYARLENELQDLLVEPVIQFLLAFITCAFKKEARSERVHLLGEYSKFKNVFDDKSFLQVERELMKRLQVFKKSCSEANEWIDLEGLIKAEVDAVTFSVFRSYYPQYNERTFFDQCVTRFLEILQSYFDENNGLAICVEKFAGRNCLPIMTIHKSKGLEFTKVFFIGFEDQNFWSYRRQPEEDTCAFFVALSRAKEEVYFTFSRKRVNNFGSLEIRSIDAISPMFQSLSSSNLVGVKDFMSKS